MTSLTEVLAVFGATGEGLDTLVKGEPMNISILLPDKMLDQYHR